MSGKRTSRNRIGATRASLPAPPSSSSTSTRSRRSGATSVQAHGEVAMPSQQPSQDHSHYHTRSLTRTLFTSAAEQEPRRSVRATKGQHTKAFEALENGPQPTKRKQAAKKGKKVAQKEEEEEDEEVIRCVCGAISQDNDDPNEPWIACEKCGAWQHNVCLGMSIFDDDLPKEYFCEQCKPEDHQELLDGMARGEEPWITRRQKHEDENKKKKGGKKGKAKRVSDSKDRTSPAASASKAKPSPTPEVKKEEEPAAKGKRKQRDHSQGPQSKLRKVAETPAVASSGPKYTPPEDLATSADKLEPAARKKVAQGLQKSLEAALDAAVKDQLFSIPKDSNKKSLAERHALEIERALHDSHSQQAATTQARTLIFNLKRNVPLAIRVFNRSLSPPTVASMSTNELATEELQRETAEMKAKADKQSTLVAEEAPRVRRTHKGDEIVENESFTATTEEVPSVLRRQSVKDASAAGESSKSPGQGASATSPGTERPAKPLRVDTQAGAQRSPKFDIDKVFSSVRSPSASAHQRRPSAPVPSTGPGVDPDVDRMLDDGTDSPPYSPTENLDPDAVWHGDLKMGNTAEFRAVAKYAGGADLSKQSGIAWNDLIPVVLNVAGRIPEDKAVPYLCGLRYNNQIDLVITSLSVADPNDVAARANFQTVVNYFMSKKRYGVVGDRKLGNVRDTYLVPIPEGDGPLPEPLQNIEGHLIPQNRTEPLLLLIFVYRDEKLQPFVSTEAQVAPVPQGTPTPSSMQASTPVPDRRQSSVAAPTWSPATPQAPPSATFPSHQSHTPIPPPVIPGQVAPVAAQAPSPAPQPPHQAQPQAPHQAQPQVPHQPQPQQYPSQPPQPQHQPQVQPQPHPQPQGQQPQHHAEAQHQHQPPYQMQPPPQIQQPPQLQQPAQFQPQPPAQPRQTPGHVAAPSPPPPPTQQEIEALKRAQAEGEEKARQVLGPLFNSPTVTFLLPHAARMKEGEWNAVKRCLERDPHARNDLPLLSKLLTEEGNNARQNGQTTQAPQQQHPNSASPGVVQTTLAAAAANLPPGAPQSAPSATVQPKA
ncbi:transcription factor gsfR2 [Apiospora phragmitis]|uniref:Transcription factor BYE1 n=1 Tax=Apiospora phragmitis TaxID=2905665 RepID=A0ABR1W827_9PEZI